MIFTAPILILLLALFVTKSMIVSLILGIISANSIYLFFKKISLFKYTFSCFCSSIIRTITTPSYQYALIFLFVLSLTINILIELKIVESYQKIILSLIKKTKYLLVTILGSSWLFFIDDYLITLSLKNFFSPLLSEYGVKKETFSYFISSNAPCICTLIPMTSWTAIILTPINEAIKIKGFDILGYQTLLLAIPFFLYPLSSIITSWLSVLKGIRFEGVIPVVKPDIQNNKNHCINYNDIALFLLPFFIMFIFIVYSIVSIKYTHSSVTISEIIDSMNVSRIMSIGIVGGMFLLVGIVMLTRSISPLIIIKNIIKTADEMWHSFLILILVWTFSYCIGAITNVDFLYSSPLYTYAKPFFPLIIMIIISFLSALTGSSWGAICLTTPFLLFAGSYEEFVVYIGSAVSGALAGSHLSIFSDAITVSATAANIDIIEGYRSQLPYTISAIISSLLLFIFFGFNYSTVNTCNSWMTHLVIVIAMNAFIFSMTHYVMKYFRARSSVG